MFKIVMAMMVMMMMMIMTVLMMMIRPRCHLPTLRKIMMIMNHDGDGDKAKVPFANLHIYL